MDESVLFREPVQASVLLERLRHRQADLASGVKLQKLRIGLDDVDEYVLLGGIQRGCVVGVSSGGGDESPASRPGRPGNSNGEAAAGAGRLVILHALVRALFEYPHSHASIIDSTGSFPLTLLARVIRWQIARNNRQNQRSDSGGVVEPLDISEMSVDSKVIGVLERVSITRVFDIEGLWEVLGEVRHGSGHRCSTAKGEHVAITPVNDGKTSRKEPANVSERNTPGNQEDEMVKRARTPEIMDSEQDDEDDDDLYAHSVVSKQDTGRPESEPVMDEETDMRPDNSDLANETNRPVTTELVMVDNMAALINELFVRTDRSAAHKLLTQLAHTLTSMTHSSNITVFLLNTLTPRSSRKISHTRDRQSSVFAAISSTPSLGMIFDSFVDLHLMCHSLPASLRDAERFYGGVDRQENGAGNSDGQDPRDTMELNGNDSLAGEDDGEILFANIIEVLRDDCPDLDRWEGVNGDDKPRKSTSREQRWATFSITDGVGLVNVNFDSSVKDDGVYQRVAFGRRP